MSTLDSFVVRKERRAYKDALECLKSVFGYDKFRAGQRPVIDALLDERCDAFVLWSTGSGKSLTFQIPALMFSGVTIVVSPLIALMSDQVAALKARNVPAECYNSAQKATEQKAVLKSLMQGDVKLLYVSPERVVSDSFLVHLTKLHAAGKLSLFAIDESHCVSSWGHDFRPSYRRLSVLKQRFAAVPMLALTATATPTVVEDVMAQLHLHSPRVFRMSFNRANIIYEVAQVGVAERACGGSLFEDIKRRIAAITLRVGVPRVAGIVYCHKRDDCDSVAQQLTAAGFRAAAYHSTAKKREQVLADWTAGKLDITVATIAFGMGIDKPDVRFVIHFNVSKSLEAFYQESGRAGRDGKPSWSILYASKDDFEMQRFLATKDGGRVAEYDDDGQTVGGVQSQADAHARQQRQLKALDDVAKYTLPKCRRVTLLAHFGETVAPATTAGAGNNGGAPCCDFCTSPETVKKDYATQQRLDTSTGTSGTSFGAKTVSTTGGHVQLSQFVGARAALQQQQQQEETDDYYSDDDEPKAKRVDLSKARGNNKWAALEAAEAQWKAADTPTNLLGRPRGAGFRAPRPALTSAPPQTVKGAATDGGFSSALRMMRDAAGPMYSAGAKTSAPISAGASTLSSTAKKTPTKRKKVLDLTECDDGADEKWEQ